MQFAYNSVLVLTEIELEFVLRHPEGVDLTVTIFFVKYALKSQALYINWT